MAHGEVKLTVSHSLVKQRKAPLVTLMVTGVSTACGPFVAPVHQSTRMNSLLSQLEDHYA